MAILDIKASTLRAKESAELQAAVQQELAAARVKVEEQEQNIAALLGENTKLKSQVAATQEAESQLVQEKEDLQAKLDELTSKLRESSNRKRRGSSSEA